MTSHPPLRSLDLAPALALALALAAALPAACKTEIVCPVGQVVCGGACVDLAADPLHCGACGQACGSGNACQAGACSSCSSACASARGCSGETCLPDLLVACPATSEVLPRAADLSPVGPGRAVAAGLTALASAGGVGYAASGYPAAAVRSFSTDPRQAAAPWETSLAGSDLEDVVIHGGAVLVSNASVGALDVLSADGRLLDEIPLGAQQAGPNPHGIAVLGSAAYVALYGYGAGTGQAVAVVDLSGLSACLSPDPAAPACGAGCSGGRHCVGGTCRVLCGALSSTIDLLGVTGSHDAPGLPFPSRALAAGSRVFVALANLMQGPSTYYTDPAGSGRLAVIDAAAGNAVSIVDLGASCGNPGGLTLGGTTLWVSCGSFSQPGTWPGRLVPVDVAGGPAVGPALDVSAVIPNGVAVCGGRGYVGDQASGRVLPFDPAGRTTGTAVEVCPLSAPPGPPDYGYAYVATVACQP